MIARAITAIIGVVIGLFATFAVFSAILGGLDNFYLLTQDACNYGSHNSPQRILRVAPENSEHPRDADEIDWTRDGLDLRDDGTGACEVVGDYDEDLVYLSPDGNVVDLTGGTRVVTTRAPVTGSASLLSSLALFPDQPYTNIGFSGSLQVLSSTGMFLTDPFIGETSTTAWVFRLNTGRLAASVKLDSPSGFYYGDGVGYDRANGKVYALDNGVDEVHVYDFNTPETIEKTYSLTDITRNSLQYHADPPGDFNHPGLFAYESDTSSKRVALYEASTGGLHNSWSLDGYLPENNFAPALSVRDDGALFVFDKIFNDLYVSPDYTDASTDAVKIDADFVTDANYYQSVSVGPDHHVYLVQSLGTSYRLHQISFAFAGGGVSTATVSGADLAWIQAEDVFTAQEQLVTLLAVIAAIGMPIGAMTAIVFFGQAVLSSGMTGQGASQVLVAIAAVVIILVSIQMFQQFAGFLGTAFDAVNGDRFVVFDETLGSLAETIAEFWGVLAFAGFINIATIVWRNYSGNFSIGGTQGGL